MYTLYIIQSAKVAASRCSDGSDSSCRHSVSPAPAACDWSHTNSRCSYGRIHIQTYGISAEQNAGGQHVVLVVLLKIVADDQRRRHVDEARAEAVHETVGQEQPLGGLHERRPGAADCEDAGAE